MPGRAHRRRTTSSNSASRRRSAGNGSPSVIAPLRAGERGIRRRHDRAHACETASSHPSLTVGAVCGPFELPKWNTLLVSPESVGVSENIRRTRSTKRTSTYPISSSHMQNGLTKTASGSSSPASSIRRSSSASWAAVINDPMRPNNQVGGGHSPTPIPNRRPQRLSGLARAFARTSDPRVLEPEIQGEHTSPRAHLLRLGARSTTLPCPEIAARSR
jgi:hypothetical protein